MIEELASRVFQARDAAHRAHWKSTSYSQHMALGAFYDDVIEAIDGIVESYQGEFGLIGEFQLIVPPVSGMAGYLKVEADWIATNRDKIARGSCQIQNQLDSLVSIYRTTVYKLVNLK